MASSSFSTMWLTVNRECNFRCKWCYAEGAESSTEDDMSLETARGLIDLASNLGIKEMIVIGGEPTFWNHLFETIGYIHEKKMLSTLVTNGYMLSKGDFLEKIKASHLDNIGISLKAANREQHLDLTGVDVFFDVLKGIENASKIENKKVSVSYVLSKLTIDNLKEAPKVLANFGVKNLILDMCSVVFDGRKIIKGYALEPNEYVRAIVDNIDEMCRIMDGGVCAPQQTMGCIWPKETLKRLIEEGKVATGSCQMCRENGIVFTSDAEMIPCNVVHDYPLGKFGVEFSDAKSFLEFRSSPPVAEFFKNVKTYPKASCIDCSGHTDCIGGCPLQWAIFDPNEITNEYEVKNL